MLQRGVRFAMRAVSSTNRWRTLGAVLFVLFSGVFFALPAGAKGKVHEVKKGGSLWAIAHRYGVTVAALREKNGLEKGDPIVPGQKLEIPSKDYKSGKSRRRTASENKKADWVVKKPPPSTQVQKTAKERGVNPCNTPDPGWGVYDHWSRAPSMGQMISPQRGGISRSGRFDVMIHFHGHEAVRKEWVQVMNGTVLVGIDLGIGSGPYNAAFQSPNAFKKLVESVEEAMAKKTGKKNARVRHVGLSSWSAGYGAVQEIINQPYGKKVVDTVILLDGLHSGYQGNSLNEAQLKPFTDWAKEAAHGRKFMFVSHSSIIPPGYASTTETANYLVAWVGGHPRPSRPRPSDPVGMDLISWFVQGSFHVRGYAGNDKMDHCAQLTLYQDILRVHVRRRWGV